MDQPFTSSGQAPQPRAATASTGQEKNPLRSAAALLAKEFIWRFVIRFKPAKRPICLYASRRSGSTLLMEVISVNAGVMFSDQPFCLYTASSANLNRLPISAYGQVAFPDPEEQAILHSYLDGILSGRVRTNIPWKLWSKEFHFWNDRICLKITDAKAMVDWIDTQFDVHTVVSTRHPVAQAISVANVGWLSTGKGFLRNPEFVERWLDDEREAYCWDLYHHGSDLERRIVDWSLENLPLLSVLPQRKHWLYVSYEDLIAHTDAAVKHLSDQLQLDNSRQMVRRAARPSRSTKRESTAERKQLIQQGNREQLLNSWRSKVADDELQSCFRILERLGIDLYRPDSSMPDHQRVGREGFCRTQAVTAADCEAEESP